MTVPGQARRRAGSFGVGLVLLLLAHAGALAQDGATTHVDDVPSLLEALEQGGVVLLAPGEYDLDETVVLRGQVEVRALDAGSVQLNLRSAPLGVAIEPGAEVRLTRVVLRYDAEAPGDVLWIRDAQAAFEDVAVGMAVAGASDDAERPLGVGSGVVVSGTADVRVVGGVFGRNEGYAFEVRDASSVRLENVVVVNNGGGIHVDGDARLTMLGGEVHSHVGSALHVGGRASVRTDGSLFEHNGTSADDLLIAGVWVADDAELVVHGGHLRDNPGGAIEAVGSSTVRLEDVTIERAGTWAHTYVLERSTLHVVGGTFVGNEGGLYVGDAASAVLDGVVMIGDGRDGGVGLMADGFADLEVRDGRIEDFGAFGVHLLGSARATIEGTSVRGNRTGLVAADASMLVAHSIEAIDQVRSGVGFLDASRGEVSASTLADNGWFGVVVAGAAVADVIDNVFAGNGQRGAWFDETASGRFDGNAVSASPVGLEIAHDASVDVGENAFDDVREAVVGE